METTATISPTSELYPLPSDYLSFRNVTALTDPRRQLDAVVPEYLESNYPNREAGYPAFFAIEGDSIRVAPTTPNDIELRYYAKLDLATDTTNWLLTKNPDIYLFGSLTQAAAYLSDDAVAKWGALYETAIAALETDNKIALYAKGGARLKGPTP